MSDGENRYRIPVVTDPRVARGTFVLRDRGKVIARIENVDCALLPPYPRQRSLLRRALDAVRLSRHSPR